VPSACYAGATPRRPYTGLVSRRADTVWLDRLAEDAGAKVELDDEGSVIVSPATDAHLVAAHALYDQLRPALPVALLVFTGGPRWNPLGADHPSYVPDLSVVEAEALRRLPGSFALQPPPLLVIEICSPESRRRDLEEKADAYHAGGAHAYWTVEVPALSHVTRPEATVRRRAVQGWETEATVSGDVTLSDPVWLRCDLDRLSR
jgi:Uma2 family endonuclease